MRFLDRWLGCNSAARMPLKYCRQLLIVCDLYIHQFRMLNQHFNNVRVFSAPGLIFMDGRRWHVDMLEHQEKRFHPWDWIFSKQNSTFSNQSRCLFVTYFETISLTGGQIANVHFPRFEGSSKSIINKLMNKKNKNYRSGFRSNWFSSREWSE